MSQSAGISPRTTSGLVVSWVLGLIGAALGGWLGAVAFGWALKQGFYAMVMPPALVGVGAGLLVRHRSQGLAILCGILGLSLGLWLEWRYFPFTADSGGGYFLTHLHQLRPITWLMLGLGTFLSYRMGLGWERRGGV